MAIKVLINGAFGRMGQMTTKALSENGEFEVVGQTGREYDLAKSIHDSAADVVIDFTTAESVFENVNIIIDNKARPVIGTTGLTQDQIRTLQEKSKELEIGGIIAPNFSIGAVLMMKFAGEIVKYMPNVEIIEMHHDQKLDSPSGTALRTAELMAHNAKLKKPSHSRETIKGARGATHENIAIHAVRLPGLLAHQQIIFGGVGEALTLRHDSIDRQCFMPGVQLACKKVLELDHLVYGLESIIE
jgi:4-hydroxy-tetrahydrodipicolinate reductase